MSDNTTPKDKVLERAEEHNPIVEEAQDERDIPKRDTDEFTDQHLEAPEIDPEIEKNANQKTDNDK